MKNSLLAICLLSTSYFSAQVIFGTGKTSSTSTSVSLEFGTENKGLLLPAVIKDTSVSGAIPGTMIFDSSDKKVKVKLTNSWKDLTINTTGKLNPEIPFTTEATDAKVSIGTVSYTPGILVLEDNNKAMILPEVSSYQDIVNPSAGMMVYLKNAKQMALYNGTVWTFWKP